MFPPFKDLQWIHTEEVKFVGYKPPQKNSKSDKSGAIRTWLELLDWRERRSFRSSGKEHLTNHHTINSKIYIVYKKRKHTHKSKAKTTTLLKEEYIPKHE